MGLVLPKLEPCPYCGGQAFIDIQMDTMFINAYHSKKCLMKPDTWLISKEPLAKQIKAWNMRPKEKK